MKDKKLISVRPKQTLAERFNQLVSELGLKNRSELAEEAIEDGLESAAARIRKRKLEEAEGTVRKLKSAPKITARPFDNGGLLGAFAKYA